MQPIRKFLACLGAVLAMALGAPALASAGSIAGQVIGPDGQPLPFVFVQLHDRDDIDAMPGFATTDDHGEFRFADLAPGDYLVRAAMSSVAVSDLVPQWFGDVSSRRNATPIHLADASSERSDITVRLVRGASVGGTVTGPSGTPVAALVTAVDEDGAFFAGAGSDTAGRYRIANVPPGRVTLRFRPIAEDSDMVARYLGDTIGLDGATFVDVGVGDDLTGYDHQFTNGHRISGCLTEDGGGPLSGVDVIVWSGTGPEAPRSTVSRADGCYAVRGLGDGSHVVGFGYGFRYSGEVVEYYDDAATREGAESVTVAGADATGVDAALPVPRSISGRVTGPDGEPAEGVTVTAQHEMSTGGMRTATTGADGRFRVVGVAEGRHTISFAGSRYATRYYDGASSFLDATMVTVDGDTPHLLGVDEQLTERPHVRGTVTDDRRDPVASARVVAIRDGCPVAETLADDRGRYVLGVPSAGAYRVAFVRPGGGLPLDVGSPGTGTSCPPLPPPLTAGSTPPPDATDLVTQYFDHAERLIDASPIDVPADAGVPDVNGQLADGGSLSGRVLGDDGHPVANVYVTAYSAGGTPIAETTTAVNGSYRLRGVAAGSVTVRYAFASSSASATDPPEARYYRDATDRASGVAVAVSPGQATSLDDVTLERPASISGRATDAVTGQAVAFTAVMLTRWDGDVPVVAGVTTTSPIDGGYRFDGVLAGRYSVSFVGGGMSSYVVQYYNGTPTGTAALSGASILDIEAGDEVSAIDGRLRVGGTIRGRVTGRDSGLGIADATVLAREADTGRIVLGVQTDLHGDYRLPPLPAGVPVTLEFRPAEGSSYQPSFYGGATLEDADPVVPVVGSDVVRDQVLDAGGTVTGRVVYDDDGGPIEGATVTVIGTAGLAAAITEADGTFSVGGLAPGRYQYVVWPRPGDPGIAASSTEDFEVALGTTTPLAPIRLQVGGFIVGRAAIAGEPTGLTAVEVAASRSDGTTTEEWSASTDAHGDYRIGPLPAGDYEVRFGITADTPGEFDAEELYYDGVAGAGSADDAVRVAVSPRSTASGIDVAFTPKGTVPPPPSNTVAPSITGDALEGATLSGAPGTWSVPESTFDRQWLRCDSSGAACVPVDGATGSSYELGVPDVGATIRLRVVATHEGRASEPAISVPTAVVTAVMPTIAASPTVTGGEQVGSTLSADAGSWTPSSGSYSYEWRWLRCSSDTTCVEIGGATNASYALAAADVGSRIAVEVRATRLSRSSAWVRSTLTAAVVPLAPVVTQAPAISGTPVRDQTLTVSTGTWSSAPTGYAYRWLRCPTVGECTEIDGATTARYRLGVADVGRQIAAEVQATNPGGTSAWSRSARTATVTAPRDPEPDPGPGPDTGGVDQDPPGSDPGRDVPPPSGEQPTSPVPPPPAADPPPPPPPVANPPRSRDKPGAVASVVRVRQLRLAKGGSAIELRISGRTTARTTVTVTSRVALKVGKRRGKAVIAKFMLKRPTTTTVRLSSALRKALRGRKSLPVTVRVAPKGGKAVAKRMTLRLT